MEYEAWSGVSREVLRLGGNGKLTPFLGAALSSFAPTCLPQGDGMIRATLEGVFGTIGYFQSSGEARSEEQEDQQRVVLRHSPEVVLQGLFEGLPGRVRRRSPYDVFAGAHPNQAHTAVALALAQRSVPATFTTNPDPCLERAAGTGDVDVAYDAVGFGEDFGPRLYLLHGAVGREGLSTDEFGQRARSLTNTLHSMGPKLSNSKHARLQDALSAGALLVLGYSGCDPDIWYSLDALLQITPNAKVYWCVRPTSSMSRHLRRLWERHPASVRPFEGDIGVVLGDLANVWGLGMDLGALATDEEMSKEWVRRIAHWADADNLAEEEREIALGWVLTATGEHGAAAKRLEAVAKRTREREAHLAASLFAGYARREMSDHVTARGHLLRAAREANAQLDVCRYAQAANKIGESISAFECVQPWYLRPERLSLHGGARWLHVAIAAFRTVSPEEASLKQMGRSSLGNAIMNLAQLYRRTSKYPGGRRALLRSWEIALLHMAITILTAEGDLRSLPMAQSALAADEPGLNDADRLAEINKQIERAVHWNQDAIQIGAAYFARADIVRASDRWQAEKYYTAALASHRRAGMKAEIARTALELSVVVARDRGRLGKAIRLWAMGLRGVWGTQGSLLWRVYLPLYGAVRCLCALVGGRRR